MPEFPLLNRRQWLAASAALARGGAAPARNSRDLVSTPQKRAAYLKNMLEALCTRLGPRPAGSPGDQAAAPLIQREMERALPSVALDTFTFSRWVLDGESLLEVGGRRLETYVAENSPSTPAEGVRGVLRKGSGESAPYELVDGGSGRVLARIGLGPFGPAVAGLYRGSDGIPIFSSGRQDRSVLDSAASERVPVRLKAVSRWVPAKSSNVVGTLPGASRQEILYVAHADTKYNTAGASDNTATMIAMLMLAHGMSGRRPARTITFVATAGEEIGYLGAKHYAETRKAHGTLGNVKICLNLDSLTYGPNLQVATTDRELWKILLDVHRGLRMRSQPKLFERDDTMDSAPFRAAGARTMHFNSRGHDARTLPLNHRPDDRADTIDPELIESSYRILMEFTARLDKLPL